MKYVNCRTRGRDSSARSSGTDSLQVLAIFPVKIGHHFQVTLLVLDVGVEEIGFSLDHLPPPRRKSMPHISGQRPFGRNEAQCTFFLLLPGPEHWRTPNNLEFEEVGNGNGKPSTGFLRCADSGLEREDERMSGPVGFLPPDIASTGPWMCDPQ